MRRILWIATVAGLADAVGEAIGPKAAYTNKQRAGYLRGVSSATAAAPKRLGVILPTSTDDLGRMIESLAQWPSDCPTTAISQHVDLVLYYVAHW